MSQGTLFANFRIRTWLPRAIVKSLSLDVKILEPESNVEYWSKLFPLKKVPCYVGSDGFKLTQQLAILVYLVNLSDNNAEIQRLLGKGNKEKAEVLQWLSLANTDLCLAFTRGAFPLNGRSPYNKKQVDDAYAELDRLVQRYEQRLNDHKYLVGDRASLADYLSAIIFTRIFETLYGKKWREEHAKLTQWFTNITEDPFVSFLWEGITLCDEPLPNPPTK
ncbi:translation elongation factor EF1B gamma [Kluyveromyces lactis]|uniref:KLLA0D11594p n=1 Tax=Kluyveromyces lactis (strain ATCC 8585 / CBS 2359 / DSM 70799 / NBRC 1267 / NRRL Y-1140 / WM37) TaxID=284590 RepID=Q6CR61_KLULA|nr:uncharacterized protein KLLA0_D11594g [Kluyveromyces lactis]CAH00674.1 KLLA0D11594p [Kluyveromyces lactis]|eukprot:XP_453578.1 uncharacterized protein KLLA0_D11594g [Kluyveromyces lactis]